MTMEILSDLFQALQRYTPDCLAHSYMKWVNISYDYKRKGQRRLTVEPDTAEPGTY